MPVLHELRDAAHWFASGTERAEVRAECAAVARRICELQLRTIGLLPADDEVGVPALALHLARALAALGGGPVAAIDARGTWAAARAGSAGDGVLTSWILDDVAVLSPPAGAPGEALSRLRRVLDDAVAFRQIVVDLTGFDRIGEHVAAAAILDGVAVVVRSGTTRLRALSRAARDLQGARPLGVLLTGL
jgi:hypothetical protein